MTLEAAILPIFSEDLAGRVLQIAAITLSRGAALVIWNAADFEGLALSFINPWNSGDIKTLTNIPRTLKPCRLLFSDRCKREAIKENKQNAGACLSQSQLAAFMG